MNPVTVDSVGDLASLIPSFERSLRVTNKSTKTVATYGDACDQLLTLLRDTPGVRLRHGVVVAKRNATVSVKGVWQWWGETQIGFWAGRPESKMASRSATGVGR